MCFQEASSSPSRALPWSHRRFPEGLPGLWLRVRPRPSSRLPEVGDAGLSEDWFRGFLILSAVWACLLLFCSLPVSSYLLKNAFLSWQIHASVFHLSWSTAMHGRCSSSPSASVHGGPGLSLPRLSAWLPMSASMSFLLQGGGTESNCPPKPSPLFSCRNGALRSQRAQSLPR